MQKSKLDQFFSIPAAAVLMAIVCNVLWGSAFPFIKLGYRLFAIDSADTASILCFAGVRFMIGAALVWLAGLALNHRPLPMPRGKTLASACGLGLWQTAAQYFFYYSAVALLTGAMGGILNSTQSFMGVILAHFLYGNKDRLTPRKALGCALGFGGDGRRPAPAERRRYPGAAVPCVHLRRGVCYMGAADEEQPGVPHRGVRPHHPHYERPAVGAAQR